MAHLTPTSQQHKVLPVLFRALNGKYQLFIPSPSPTEIELRAQEKYKITSQCRAWVPVWISRGLKSHPGLKNSPRFPWSPQHGPSISSYQTCHSALSYKGGCTSKVIYHWPVQGQPLPMLCFSMVSQCPNQQHYGTVSKVALWWEEGLITEDMFPSFIYLLFRHIANMYQAPGTQGAKKGAGASRGKAHNYSAVCVMSKLVLR